METLHNTNGFFAPDQTTDADVVALSSDGRGIARIPQQDGRNIVCFIEDALPGQRVRVRLTGIKARLLEGFAESVLSPSPHQRPAPCAHSDTCGGCPWQGLDYDEQCRWKAQILADSLLRLGKIDVFGLPALQEKVTSATQSSLPFCASPYEWGFRNKMTFAFEQTDGGLRLGQRGRRSHTVADITACRLQDPLTMRILAALREVCAAHTPADWRYVVVRRPGGDTGKALRVEVIVGPQGRVDGQRLYRGLSEAVPEVTGFAVSLRKAASMVAQGEKTLFSAGDPDNLEVLHRPDGTTLRLAYDDRSFLQVNTPAAELLYVKAAQMLSLAGDERLWDLYCGVGSIGLYLAPLVAEVRGIESVSAAIVCARANAESAGFQSCSFAVGDAATAFAHQLRALPPARDVVVVDPPRAGLDKRLVAQLIALRPEKICYISCNPATLARDAALLSASHQLVDVCGVDLFPHTPHVEAVCLFQRK